MGETTSGVASRSGYFQQYLARMAPTPLPPPPVPFPAASAKPMPSPAGPYSRRAISSETGNFKGKQARAVSSAPRKSLVDAFKQHGMRLCDGSKLNAVSKGVTHLGAIPPTLGVHITAVYLSQNDLTRLDGVEQFQSVRLLSVAANRLAQFAEIDRLRPLAQLRHLNLMGNPLCDYPNYRFRIIDALRQLAVLDTVEISKLERDMAPAVASQDRALREMVLKNHVEIQKLQRLVAWIRVLGELQCGVLRDAATGRYDQLPTLHISDAVFTTEKFLRVWRYEESLERRDCETLETRMMIIIARTRSKLAEETPSTKAKEMLFKLANASVVARRRTLNDLPAAMRRDHSVWEDAYAHILQLQQQTIANLRSECDRNRQATLEAMRELMIVNPLQRCGGRDVLRRRSGDFHFRPCNRDAATETSSGQEYPENAARRRSIESPNQGEDRECVEPVATSRARSMIAPTHQQSKSEGTSNPTKPNRLSLRRVLRSGQFGNKGLKEAIQSFSLREPVVLKPPPRGRQLVRTTTAQTYAACVSSNPENGDATEQLVTREAIAEATATAPNTNSPCMRDRHFFKGHESSRKVPSETVCSADTVYARSVSEFSSGSNTDTDFIHTDPFVFTSRAQQSRHQDELIRYQETPPHDLNTVCEDEEEEDGDLNSRVMSNRLPRFLNERQHELEEREEKYITALMESEQRELDLRQQMSVMDKQVTRFQQLLSQSDHERQRMKREIHARTSAIARPKMLRRCFVRWIQYHQWSLQVRRFQRKRRFINQHDAFWSWRRQVWARHELHRIHVRQQTRVLRNHLTEWANLTRISVIAHHTHALRQSQLMKRILDEWRQQVLLKRLREKMLASRSQSRSQERLGITFVVWKRFVGQRAQIERLQSYYARAAVNTVKQSAMGKWKMYVLTIARPRQTKVDALTVSRVAAVKKSHFVAWRSSMLAEKFHVSHLRRKLWLAWRASIRNHVAERERVLSYRSEVLKLHVLEWRRVTVDRVASRRSLNLATRHVNHRRLRKLWMYWKIYSIAVKRYKQGAIKSRRHYYKKLLRHTWAKWQRDTRDNLVTRKRAKHGELCYHFNALRVGVRQQLQAKTREKFVSHAAKRRLFAQVRKSFAAWAACTKRRRHSKTLYQYVVGNRTQAMKSLVWSRWKHQRIMRLQLKLLASQQLNEAKIEEHQLAERDLAVLQDRSVSLDEQVRRLTSQLRDRDKEIHLYQEELQQRELNIEELEKELDGVMQRLLQANDDRKDATKRAQLSKKDQQHRVRDLEKENDALKARATELEGTIEALSRSVEEARMETSSMQAQLVEAQRQVEDTRSLYHEREQSLRDSVGDLEKRLEEEHRERQETVQRLQEYEARIASTCAEISDHENAHERECIQLREEKTRIDILHNEAVVRSAELERLLGEKNEQIIALSIRLKDAQWKDERIAQSHHRQAEPAREQREPTVSSNLAMSSNRGSVVHNCTDGETPPSEKSAVMANSIICVPVKQMQSCVLVTTEENHVGSHTDASKDCKSLSSVPTIPSEEERRIDERTSRIHADLQLLQERITKRLQQVPCVPSVEQLTRTHNHTAKLAFDSDGASVSTLSESEHERDRKTTRRTASMVPGATSRTRSFRSAVTTQRKAVVATISDRENASRLANRSAARLISSVPPQPKPSVEPYPPSRPMASKSQISKITKRSSMNEPPPTEALSRQDAARLVEPALSIPSNGEKHSSTSIVSSYEDAQSGGRKDSSTKKSSPAKMAGGEPKLPLGIAVSTTSLAAISARLMPQLTPAELEISRIHRMNCRLAENNDQDHENASDPVATSPSRVAAALATTGRCGGASGIHDSLIAEEWVNLHLGTNGTYLLPASDIQALLLQPDVQGGAGGDDAVDDDEETFAFRRKGEPVGPLARAGIDRWTLYRLGMPKLLVDRLYRALYVYTNGFHNIINEIASHCPPTVEKHVSSNVWLTFLLLLEQCESGKYEMAMLKFKQATQTWRQEMHDEFTNEKVRIEAHAKQLEKRLEDEETQNREKSELLDKLSAAAETARTTIAELQHVAANEAEHVRLLKLEIMVHEDREKKLHEQLDDARKDSEVANAERFNALTERYALDEDMCKMQHEIERLEAEKTNYAKRMHETLFMNQALRATNESLKQSIVVLSMDKDKLESEKLVVQVERAKLDEDIKDMKLLKATVEHDLMESTRRHAHDEERLRAIKDQLDDELETNSRYVKELATLSAQLDEEKVKVGVLEATCNLLTAEKQNTGMRAQDKLRIERLLNQKLELENQLETMKLDRARDQEQIWNLKASLEALDSEMQQTKRVFSAGQQAFLHSERTAEKLRHQLQDVEKNYEKASKNLASLRERFKMFEESSKEQVTKLEVELKVTGAQLREVTYVNRDNAAVIADLTKAMEAAEKETKVLKMKLDTSEKQFRHLQSEKEHLQRDQQERDHQHSSTKQVLSKFIRDLQGMLALVKIDEFPLDEALREVLRMVKDTFGHELDISKVLDDEDEPLDFEEEYDADELAQAERERTARLSARRTGFSVAIAPTGASTDSEGFSASRFLSGDDAIDSDGDKRRLTKVSRMSKFRRTKLDTQVRKLQHDLEISRDTLRSLEDVVCAQADEIAMLVATKDQQRRWLQLNEHQKGMLLADIEGYVIGQKDARARHKKTNVSLQQAKIELVLATNKMFQMEISLQTVRRQFDMECATTEDLLARLARAYEYELLMKSLRREKAIQATVAMADQFSQTLVPQRNPVLERVRVPAMNLPSVHPTTQQAESLLQQINETTKALLPNITAATHGHDSDLLQLQPSAATPMLLRPLGSSPHHHQSPPHQTARRPRHQSPRQHPPRDRDQRHQHRQLTTGDSRHLGHQSAPTSRVPPQLVRHYNEFGTRQDVLISPVYPPYFPSHMPLPNASRVHSRFPSKPPTGAHRLSLHLSSGGDERSESAGGWEPRVPVVKTNDRQQQPLLHGGANRLRYHRGFLQAGMEVLRGGSRSKPSDDDDEDDGAVNYDDDDAEGEEQDPCGWRTASKLELAVRDFHDEQDAAVASGASPRHSPSRYSSHRLKSDESRGSVAVENDQDQYDENQYDDDDDDRALAKDTRESRFVPGVLYPLLPPR